MKNISNQFLSDVANVFLQHDKLSRILENLSIEGEEVTKLMNTLNDFHNRSSQQLQTILNDMPDVPVHNSYDKNNTFGLPMNDYSLTDLEAKSMSYQLKAITEAEHSLRKYYQDSLLNKDIPDSFKEIIQSQAEEYSELITKLERLNAIQEE